MKLTQNFLARIKSIALLVAVAFAAIALYSCSSSDKEDPFDPTQFTYQATASTTVVLAEQSSVNIATTGASNKVVWTATTSTPDFTLIGKSSGYVGENIIVTLLPNTSSESRTASIVVTFLLKPQKPVTIEIEQKGKNQGTDPENPSGGNAEYDRLWGEQPAYRSGNYIYKTYRTTLSGKTTLCRSYSICYDKDKHISHWVAYPLHDCYTSPNVSRSNAWSKDPNEAPNDKPYIDPAIQQNIVDASYGTGDARGHMLPSASRYNNVATNEMTFYSTNMMPQAYDFNSGVWVKLENAVRASKCKDTLYVVIGTLFENTNDCKWITDRGGLKIHRPSHAYKLLLRTKNGNTGKAISTIKNASDLKCIAFVYKNSNSEKDSTIASGACSVEDIEKRSGFTFFQNLDPSIAKAVKSQCNISDWSAMN